MHCQNMSGKHAQTFYKNAKLHLKYSQNNHNFSSCLLGYKEKILFAFSQIPGKKSIMGGLADGSDAIICVYDG